MHFALIELFNFGIYKGLHRIELTQGGERNITLIGGMNGRGKTTILDAVFLCLYGRKAAGYVPGSRAAYRDVLRSRISKSADERRASIRITMEADDGSGTVISAVRGWRESGESVTEELTVEKNGTADPYLAESWDYYAEELIPFGIARFFFFDSEKISRIADDESFERIKEPVKALMGVAAAESLCARLEKIRKENGKALAKSAPAELTLEAERLGAEIGECEKRLGELQEKKDSLSRDLESAAGRLNEAELEFSGKGGSLSLRRGALEAEQRGLRERESALKNEALILAANPASPLALCRSLALEAYRRMVSGEEGRKARSSLPAVEKALESVQREFRKEYGEGAECGRLSELAEKELSELRRRAGKEEADGISPAGMALLGNFVNGGSGKTAAEARRIVSESERTESALRQLDEHLRSASGKDGAAELLQRIEELQAEKSGAESAILECDEEISSLEHRKEQLERQRSSLLMRLAAEADAADDSARVAEHSTMALLVVREFVRRLQERKAGALSESIMECVRLLSEKESLITQVTIDPESLDLTLRDFRGGILGKEQLSAGERQMLAIAIIWGLARSSGYRLPVIIDTPMARLDSAHRKSFVERYLPSAGSQLLVLSTNEEISGRYLEEAAPHVGNAYTISYDEKEKCSSIVPGYFGRNLSDL
ncbi:MAG: DNA sulfur modification protein DndD [Pseudomonadota bacterium]|nr:DNA sulfur modification protein DndD [Pseudomonadota bacterium]